MELYSPAVIFGLEIAILKLSIGLAIWSLTVTILNRKKTRAGTEIYRDKDGVATEKSQSEYSVFWPNLALGAITLAGLVVAIIQPVISPKPGTSQETRWADLAISCILAVHFVFILAQRQPGVAAKFALRESIIFTFLLVARVLFLIHAATKSFRNVPQRVLYLEVSKAGLTLLGSLICMLYPTRPEVFENGYPVDRQNTVSAWSRYNYEWATRILEQNKKSTKKSLSDYRHSDYRVRCTDMYKSWQDMKKTSIFLINIHWAHFYGLFWQWFYQFVTSFFDMAPQFAMYALLKVLQRRDAGEDVTQIGIIWVIALGVGQVLAAFTNGRMWFFGEGYVHIPLRMEIPALVFAKALRKKDVRGIGKKKGQTPEDSDGISKDGEDDEDGDDSQKSRQAVINLVGVDSNRVANYMGISGWIFGAIIKLGIAVYFLQAIVGWIPLSVGIALMALTVPLNIYFTKQYLGAQDDLMKARDKKLETVNEALGGIRQIKFSALELKWEKKINDTRAAELDVLWAAFRADIWLVGIWLSAPLFINGGCLVTYAYMYGYLQPSIAFTTVSMLNKLGSTLAMFPEITTMAIDCWVSAKRIGKYLDAADKEVVAAQGSSISFQDATICWPADEIQEDTFKLFNLNMAFPNGDLSVISGRTGSGKSLLLSAILGEIELISGIVTVPRAPTHSERNDAHAHKGNWIIPSAVAFVPQIPWIENCSFKDNILFGLPYDKDRYDQVIKACALEKDLEILIDGDATEIGPKGINLSGGQCWRLTLARALYSRAGILLLDDIFSAVDAHVARHIYETALTGPISAGRTRILVTHHVGLCRPKTKYEVRLENGTVEYAGEVTELEQTLQLSTSHHDDEVLEFEDDVETILEGVERRLSHDTQRKLSRTSANNSAARKASRRESQRPVVNGNATKKPENDPKKFVEEEERESGHVSLRIYAHYLKACGGHWFWWTTIILFLIFQGMMVYRSWILRLWSGSDEVHAMLSSTWTNSMGAHLVEQNQPKVLRQDEHKRTVYYSSFYILVGFMLCLEGTIRYIFVFTGSLKASRTMFKGLTYAVLRAPLRWLDTMPVGRILNRFTADFNSIDTSQAYGMSFGFNNFLSVVGIGIAGAVVSPYLLLVTFILLGISAYYASFYLHGARDTKRLESVAKSPVFEHLSAALQGVTSLRAYEKMETYTASMFAKIDAHGRCLWHLNIYKRWLGWRLAVIGTAFSTIVAIFLVGYHSMDAALAGFALSFALSYTDAVFYLLRQYVEVELGMNSTERVIEYSEIDIETQAGADVPASWPSEGRMEVENLVVGYAADLPPVLKGLNFEVKPKERIGVVGRTGAGKSSLTLALFRFLEAREGKIYIDGVDVSTIKLHDLRSRLAIIPQDPVLFSGTVRSNLDPFDEREDSELFEALRRVHLIDSESNHQDRQDETSTGSSTPSSNRPTNANIFVDLSSPISESGSNLSQGQRQLLCLARAIVSRPKIMFLDEATSAVDKITDSLIQRSIREEFGDATLLVIAHRLSTIADFDRILVLDDGKVIEYDTPKKLWDLGPEKGIFRAMVESSGERDLLSDMIVGAKAA